MTAELPRWDMESIYGGPVGVAGARDEISVRIAEMEQLFDRLGVGSATPSEVSPADLELAIVTYMRAFETASDYETYLTCVVSADTADTGAQSALSALEQQRVRLAKLDVAWTAWIGRLELEPLLVESAVGRGHAFVLRDAKLRATHQMSRPEEELAAELQATGGNAWFRLRDDLEAGLTATIELDGAEQIRPIAEVWNLIADADRETRRMARTAVDAAFTSQSTAFAAALNGIKGETIALAARRGWADPLDVSLAQNRIDRETLEVLMGSIRDAMPDYHRYLRAKARALGTPKLASYDLFAPMGVDASGLPFAEAMAQVEAQFTAYSPEFGKLARLAGAERWIDAGPREHKVGGGFCSSLPGGVSRILLNYAPNTFWMDALAHELGHAYHHAVQHRLGRTWLQCRLTPATLAETASTFCQTLARDRAWATVAQHERLELANSEVLGHVSNVFEIVPMFDLEHAIFAARHERQLTVPELMELSISTQRATVGDAMEQADLTPVRWATTIHYFLPDYAYYTYPYAFGMLFALGLYGRYRDGMRDFQARFDELLADTGMATPGELAARFGIDLHAPAFWESGLAQIRASIDRFESLVDSRQ